MPPAEGREVATGKPRASYAAAIADAHVDTLMLPIVVAFVDIESTSIAANFTNEGFQVPVDAQVFKPDDYQVPTPETFRAPTDAAPNGPVIYQVAFDDNYECEMILDPCKSGRIASD
ncbi:unnamed protein product [Cuscuta epithymum]|uniref:Uncharacterized protein n=1 Tax=Cuscuta epithymum TaxID=186058 RepID=A0AAV0DJA2_9ASTE|nr:unnamed protein product [Cuscuta epithymum]